MLVWDVLTASPIARLQDVPAAREILREYAAKVTSMDATITTGGNAAAGSAAATGVASLAWVLPGSQTLAVVLSPALLLLWDVTSRCTHLAKRYQRQSNKGKQSAVPADMQ